MFQLPLIFTGQLIVRLPSKAAKAVRYVHHSRLSPDVDHLVSIHQKIAVQFVQATALDSASLAT